MTPETPLPSDNMTRTAREPGVTHMTFRYDTTKRWLKGNTHIHSNASDAGRSFGEIATIYAGGGYDFLFRTDHWVGSDVAADLEIEDAQGRRAWTNNLFSSEGVAL
jgi:hypothetical protein